MPQAMALWANRWPECHPPTASDWSSLAASHGFRKPLYITPFSQAGIRSDPVENLASNDSDYRLRMIF
ncbi:unnamed protein product, partial [Iphiclides podalirius]